MKKYTKAQRKLIHSAYVAAVPFLENGGRYCGEKTPYICFAIIRAVRNGCITDVASKLAQEVIMDRLHAGHNVVDVADVTRWLYTVAKVPSKQLTRKNIQEYRHRWLAALIEEFSV